MKLFLASFRFKRDLLDIWYSCIPFFLISLIGVLIITFVPALTVGVVKLFGL